MSAFIDELIHILGTAASVVQILDVVLQEVTKLLNNTGLKLDVESIKKDIEALTHHKMAAFYSQHFNDDEVKELLTFYKSPVGQKMLRISPAFSKESLDAATAEGEAIWKKHLINDKGEHVDFDEILAALDTKDDAPPQLEATSPSEPASEPAES